MLGVDQGPYPLEGSVEVEGGVGLRQAPIPGRILIDGEIYTTAEATKKFLRGR
jgi:hypothetical protein